MKKILSALLVLCMVFTLGMSTMALAEEPLKLTFFDKNTGDAFDNPVAERIIELTGVTVEIQQPTGDPEEKLNLMLASGDLPDIVLMDRRSTIVNRYIAAGALIPLDDLIDEHGPNIRAMYGDVLEKSRYTDGKNYYLNNWYGLDPDPDRAINIRMDLLNELGYGERAMAGDYFTQDELVEILSYARDNYSEIDGQSVIPLSFSSDYMSAIVGSFKGMYGMKNYYEHDDELELEVRDPRYLDMVKFVNKLYRENLLDKEWAVNKQQMLDQKLTSGRVFATVGGLPTDANNALARELGDDTDTQFYMFRVVAEGTDPTQTTFSPRSTLGWDAIGITVANQDPVKTIQFIDKLASEEGQYLLMWGLEGEHWDIEDGVHVPKPEVLTGFRENWGEYAKETGIRKWVWFIKNGFGSDGTPYDLAGRYDRTPIASHALTSMAGSVWDTAPYDNLGPVSGTAEAFIEQKLIDIMDKGFAAMVYAESEEQVETLYNAMIADLDANQASTVEEIYTKNYQERLALWE